MQLPIRSIAPLALGLLLAAGAAQAVEYRSLGFSFGTFDTAAAFEDKGTLDSTEVGLQLRWANIWALGLGPIAGASVNGDSAFWVYAGLRRPFNAGEHWLVSPSFAFTFYEQGDSKDLGNELEFRSGIEVAYRFAGGSTLGAEFYHLSNASISDVNPGSNSLVLLYAIPLGRP